MRRVLLIATLVALGLAGTAYAAIQVSNVYVVTGKVTPKKSGTKAHPVPIASTIAYTVTTRPKGERPNVISQLVFTVQGVQAHTNSFPTCSTSRLNNTSQGPSTCPKASLVGTGFFLAEVGAAGKQSGPQIIPSCRVELSIYNGGGNSLSYYIYTTKAAGECPAVAPFAFVAHVAEKGTTLVQTIKVPPSVRHPGNNTKIDAATIKAFASLPLKTITTKSKKVKGKTVKGKKVGFFESILCPPNGRRHVSVKFTLENGKSQTATANVACS
jgi:hypothetical protein